MAANNFSASEEAYFKLRGQFDTGRITQEQFDEKLRELMVQDAQGRYWMLGADSGKWYFYDGLNWVQANPAVEAAPLPASPAFTPSARRNAPAASTETPYIPPPPTSVSARGRGVPFAPILIAVAVVVLGIAAFLLFQNRDRIFIAQQPPAQITPILPPTITRAPSPTALNAPTSVAAATLAPTPIPQTPAPTFSPPTELPTAVSPTNPVPTVAVTVIYITIEPPTAIPEPPRSPRATNTTLPNVPPDVYVTALTIDPNPAKKNQNAAFTARFLNTTGGPRTYNWLVLLYDPNKSGPNQGFGESTQVPITIPVGESTFTTNHVPVTGPGGCIQLYARVGWKVSAFEKPIFPNTDGNPVTVFFDVCPP